MRKTISPQELRDTYWLKGGFSYVEARELVGVDRRTWRRWESGNARIPYAAYELLRIIAAGELPRGAEGWEGFRFFRGLLYTPEGAELTPGDLRAAVFRRVNGSLYCLGAGECRNAQQQQRPARLRSVA